MKRASECTEKKYARHNTQGDESVIVVEEETKIEVEIRTEANIAVSAEFLLEKSDEQPLMTAPPGLHGSGEIGAADDLERFLQVPAQAYFYDCPMSDCTHLDSSRPLIGIQELRECLRACNDNEEGPTYSERDFKRASDMAKQGDPVAMYMLSGDMFFPRVGTPSSKARRLELLAAAAEKGWIPAHDALIWHFLHEDGSDGTALEWSRLKKACWPAFKRLIEKDRGVSPQFAGSPNETYLLCDFMWQLQLARRGIAGAQRRVASHLLFDEPCIEAQQRKAYTWLDRAVAAGDAKAMLALGMMYEHGIAVELDRARAIQLYRKADSRGLAQAVQKLSSLQARYQNSPEWRAAGLISDGKEARDLAWCQRAVQQGSPHAKLYMAQLLATGDGVPKDVKAAFALCREAADAGLREACVPLILMYLTGTGTDPDDDEALYYVHALGLKYCSAYCLGKLYEGAFKEVFSEQVLDFGIRLGLDRKRAFRWYREAGWEMSITDAGERVRRLVASGDGAFIDEEQAREWEQYERWQDGWDAVSSEEHEPAPEEIRKHVESLITKGPWKASRGECINLSEKYADWSNLEWTKYLPEVVREAPRLKGLYLDSNDLSEEAAEDIADVIRQARALEVLELRDNAFTDASYQTIATAMRGNFTLRRVHIDAELDSEASRLIRGLCARNRNLQKLWAEFKWSSPLRFITVPTELSELLEQHLLLEDQKGGTQSASATRQRVLEMLMCLQPIVRQPKVPQTTADPRTT